MTWSLPNILTVLRLLAAPLVALVFVALAPGVADWVAFTLFVVAGFTDWLDGKIARAWGQESRFGAMLDPIADKAMVVIALAVILARDGMVVAVLVPSVMILFREVFVSGLREFLGTNAGLLQVTRLAKWKTTVQMVAIAALLAKGGFAHEMFVRQVGMDPQMVQAIMAGDLPDAVGLRLFTDLWQGVRLLGIAALWCAALLTVVTGLDYFRKAMPYLEDK